MANRLLVTRGKGVFEEIEYVCPPPGPNEIQVRAIMTGVCRSDIDMMQGNFGPLPDSMSGHEGLGEVIDRGANVRHVYPGEIVATRGEPAYADVYNVRDKEFVVVPEANPKYILEPVACGINLVYQPLRQTRTFLGSDKNVLIVGTGFLAYIAFNTIVNLGYRPQMVHVIGRSNLDKWEAKDSGIGRVIPIVQESIPNGIKYDLIIDLSSGDEVFRKQCLKPEGIYIIGAEKHPSVNTTFGFLLWNANTIFFPSPRTEYFYGAMQLAVSQIESGRLVVDSFWTRGYDRNTEWQQAFADGLNRPKNYSRGYIHWK